MSTQITAIVFACLIVVVGLFQLALAAGMPWGKLAMGGRFPGRFPPAMRVTAVVQAAVLGVLALVVLARAGLVLPTWNVASTKLIWIAVAVSVLSAIANLATPSKWERILWAPIAVALTVCSLVVALG
jgi:hypothetical protein